MVNLTIEDILNENNEEVKEIPIIKASNCMQLQDLGFDSSKVELSVSDLIRQLSVYRFNDPVQRNLVWSLEKKSLAIVSILERVHIGEIKVQILRENKKKIRNVIDGKQRLTSVRDFVKGKYALKTVPYIKGTDEEGNDILIDVNDMSFNELPKLMQDRILTYVFEIKEYEIDDEQKDEFFYRWNNGEALKASEKRKSFMTTEFREKHNELKQTPGITAGMSENMINRDGNGDLILQFMVLLSNNYSSALGSKVLDDSIKGNKITNEDIMLQTTKAVNMLQKAYESMNQETRNKGFSKTRTQVSLCVANEAVKTMIHPSVLGKWIDKFFVNQETKNKKFTQIASVGTTKKEFVTSRIELALADFHEWAVKD